MGGMNLYLQSNVYLVDGAVNGAIYDLNTGELYQIENKAKNLLHRVIDGNTSIKMTDEEKDFISQLYSLNILTDEYVEKHEIEDLKEKTRIDFVWIEVTNLCNLQCIHCYDEASCGEGVIMDINEFYHIIDELVNYGIRKLQIIGGEPFVLKEKLKLYLDYCIGKFDYIEIFTNGTLITDEQIKYIKENNIKIALSVYSYDEEMHNKVTLNQSSWKLTNNTIEKLKLNDITYRVKNVLMKDLDLGNKNTELYELSSVKDIVRLTGRANIELISDSQLKRKLITKNNFAYKITKNLVEKCISGHNCFSRRLYFSSDLGVYPCVMERRICHGNIKNKHLDEIIDNRILSFTKDTIEGCKNCEFRYCCFDCRPDSNGSDLYAQPWNCTYIPNEGQWRKNIADFITKIRGK